MLGLKEYQSRICACGFHESLIADPTTFGVRFQSPVCPICAGIDQWDRIQRARDDEETKLPRGAKAKPEDPLPSDGRRTVLVPFDPSQPADLTIPT